MDDLNTCPYCGASPIRIVPALMFGRPRIDCLSGDCPAFSADWLREREGPRSEATAADLPPTPAPPGPPPPVFLHGVDDADEEEEEPPGPIYLWATRHNDFGDV